MVRPLPLLPSPTDVAWSIDRYTPPYRATSDPSIPVDICVPACRRPISDEAISQIEAIITKKGDTKLTDCLPGGAAQTCIDSVQEVPLHFLRF